MNIRHLLRSCLSTLALVALLASTASGEGITTTSPSWAGFTSPDSQGLYHDLIHAVFAPAGFTVRHVEVPAKRGMVMLHELQADIYLGHTDPEEGIILSSRPLYEGQFHAIFRTEAFPDWHGPASMTNRRVTWRLGYYSSDDIPVPVQFREATTGVSALQRLIQNGTDFYIDDKLLILESLREAGINPDPSIFRIEPIGFRQYYPAFPPTLHGQELRSIFEAGMDRLAAQDKLRPIYAKWDLPMPRIYHNKSQP